MATLNEKNFRKSARDAIKKYSELGRVVDALYWSFIVGQYEAQIAALRSKAKKK